MGYDLKEGTYDKKQLSDNEMWETVNWLFSTHTVNETSYKFLFFKSVIDCFNLSDANGKISFDSVFRRFAEIAWNIVLKYEIRQKALTIDNKKCVLEQILNDYYVVCLDGKFISLQEVGEADQIKLYKKIKIECKRYVVGALYGDTKKRIYSFNKKEEWLELNPLMVKFIRDNKKILENLNYFKWAEFYNTVNDKKVEAKLSFLVKNGFARSNESLYRAMLAYEFERYEEEIKSDLTSNTMDMLFVAEPTSEFGESNALADVSENEYENEMYGSYEKMREYLKDPILLINNMKKKKIDSYI